MTHFLDTPQTNPNSNDKKEDTMIVAWFYRGASVWFMGSPPPPVTLACWRLLPQIDHQFNRRLSVAMYAHREKTAKCLADSCLGVYPCQTHTHTHTRGQISPRSDGLHANSCKHCLWPMTAPNLFLAADQPESVSVKRRLFYLQRLLSATLPARAGLQISILRFILKPPPQPPLCLVGFL